jgi:hypothetical protein
MPAGTRPSQSPTQPGAAGTSRPLGHGPLEVHTGQARQPSGTKPHHDGPGQRLRVHPQLVRQDRHHLPALRPGDAADRQAADTASAAHGGESPVPNDYYIQNDNPRLRDLVILDQATVIGSQQLTGSPGPNPSNLKALLTFVHKGGPQLATTPFHLTYNDNGMVIRVQEQYLP